MCYMGNNKLTPKPKRSPCLDCKDRHEGCHGKCENYINWKQATDAYNGAKRSHYSDAVGGYICKLNERIDRQARAKGKK